MDKDIWVHEDNVGAVLPEHTSVTSLDDISYN